jgi:hypothetical protein
MTREDKNHEPDLPETATVQDTTVDKAVKKYEELKKHSVSSPTRKRKAPSHAYFKVEVITPDERVWLTALKLANGDYKRLRVISPTSVRVENNPK